ncbi:hypothetical protein ABZ801_33395 [Actinomadura sp. NPDC047616]|uniref:hypothetical protein n=1 Tax=Actinomadura sp. NPDC047616 TaxID=3155914 RepID=UPI0033E8E9A5
MRHVGAGGRPGRRTARRCGAHARRRVDALTLRERQVLALVGAGLSNAEQRRGTATRYCKTARS